MPIYYYVAAVSSGFGMPKPSRLKPTVHRSCCALTLFLHESFHRCCAEGPGSEDPEHPTADPAAAECCGLGATLVGLCRPSEKFICGSTCALG